MPFSRLEIDVATPRKKPFEVANCGGVDLLVTPSGFKFVLPTRPAEAADLRDFLDTISEVRAEGE